MTAFDTYRNHSILSDLEMSVCKSVRTVIHIHRNVPSKFICYCYYDVRVRRACDNKCYLLFENVLQFQPL